MHSLSFFLAASLARQLIDLTALPSPMLFTVAEDKELLRFLPFPSPVPWTISLDSYEGRYIPRSTWDGNLAFRRVITWKCRSLYPPRSGCLKTYRGDISGDISRMEEFRTCGKFLGNYMRLSPRYFILKFDEVKSSYRSLILRNCLEFLRIFNRSRLGACRCRSDLCNFSYSFFATLHGREKTK